MDKNTIQTRQQATGSYCAAFCAARRIKKQTEKVLEIDVDVILVDLQIIETALLTFKKIMNFEVSDEELVGAAEIAAAEIAANIALDKIEAAESEQASEK